MGYWVIAIITFGLLCYLYPYLKKIFQEEVNINSEFEKMKKGNLLKFTLKNNTDECLDLDLCHLEQTDKYSFKNSGGEYERLINYLKIKTLKVYCTIVHYNHENWHGDIINLHNYSPFTQSIKPILVGIDSFILNGLSKNIIQSENKYDFDYFNTLKIKLYPREEKEISLLTVDHISEYKYIPIKCAIKIKNSSNQTQKVKLFDEKYYLTNPEVEIKSIFETVNYHEVIKYFEVNPILLKSMKIYTPNQTFINYTLNFDQIHVDNSMEERINKEWKSYFNIDIEQSFVSLLEIDVHAGQEIYISFK